MPSRAATTKLFLTEKLLPELGAGSAKDKLGELSLALGGIAMAYAAHEHWLEPFMSSTNGEAIGGWIVFFAGAFRIASGMDALEERRAAACQPFLPRVIDFDAGLAALGAASEKAKPGYQYFVIDRILSTADVVNERCEHDAFVLRSIVREAAFYDQEARNNPEKTGATHIANTWFTTLDAYLPLQAGEDWRTYIAHIASDTDARQALLN